MNIDAINICIEHAAKTKGLIPIREALGSPIWAFTPRFDIQRLGQNFRLTLAANASAIWFETAQTKLWQYGFEKADLLCLSAAFAGYQQAGWPEQRHWFPHIQATGTLPKQPFAICNRASLRLYPIAHDLIHLQALLDAGIRNLQLRLKIPETMAEPQIQEAIALGERYQAQLWINDHWQSAIRHRAQGIHLGQEDLASADLPAIQAAGLKLGISTHGYFELIRSAILQPSYLALGHIFPTPTKAMPSSPQGLTKLKLYQQLVSDFPTVAIGGIDSSRIHSVLACGVNGIAFVRACANDAQLSSRLIKLNQLIGATHHADLLQ